MDLCLSPEQQQAKDFATKVNNVRESLIRLEIEAKQLGLFGVADTLWYHHEELYKTVQSLRGVREVKRGYAEL